MLLNSKQFKMGCKFTKARPRQSPSKSKEQKACWSWQAEGSPEITVRGGLSPEDFIFQRQEKQVLVKEDGEICGQQFNIANCKDCDIFLCDHLDSAYVDSCQGCRIFIGPTSGSVFIRDCIDCKLVIACKQLRTRDTHNCDILLHSVTQPVIEDSTKLRFGCFHYFYFQLKDQFNRACLSVFDNVWFNIYNFTPGNASFEILPESHSAQDMLKSLSDFSSMVDENEDFNLDLQIEGIPRTLDPYTRDLPKQTMVIIFTGYSFAALSLLQAIHSQTNVKLAKSREAQLQPDTKNVGSNTLNKIKKGLARGPFVFLLFRGDENSPATIINMCHQQMSHEMFYVTTNAEDIAKMETIVFYTKN